jgi:hypothetical protein
VKYRLLVDLEVIDVLDALPKKVRSRLLVHFLGLRSAPDQYADHRETDSTGRRIEINIFAGFSIHYWIDPAD